MGVYVKRGSGLLEPFEVPELTLDEAINRGWERHGRLMEPKHEELLPTYPLWNPPRPWELHWPAIRWDDGRVNDFVRIICEGIGL
jgi:hypothetical protein